jgi:hypothetical protein
MVAYHPTLSPSLYRRNVIKTFLLSSNRFLAWFKSDLHSSICNEELNYERKAGFNSG